MSDKMPFILKGFLYNLPVQEKEKVVRFLEDDPSALQRMISMARPDRKDFPNIFLDMENCEHSQFFLDKHAIIG